MFSTVLKEISGYFDRRFLLALFFPSLFFWGGVLAIYLSQRGLTAALTAWSQQTVLLQTIQIVIALAWIVFFASLLDSQTLWITRQFEGYWNWPFRWLRQKRAKFYQKKLEYEPHYQNIYYNFPMPAAEQGYVKYIMPTRLGNILRNAELYPYLRYDMDAVLLWPRLYPLLPESFAKAFDATKASLDFVLIVSTLSISFAIIAGAMVVFMNGPIWLFLLCFIGGVFLAWLAYRSSLGTAVAYGQLIKSAFDLYKGELLKQMGYKAPTSLEQERKAWKNLRQIIYQNEWQDSTVLPYLTAPAPPDPSPSWWRRFLSWLFISTHRANPQLQPAQQPPISPAAASASSAGTTAPTAPISAPSGGRAWLIDWQKLISIALIFLVAGAGAGLLYTQRIQIAVPVLAQDASPYHLITDVELTSISMFLADLPPNTLITRSDLIARYSRQPLISKTPITGAQLVPAVDEKYILDTASVAIPATAAMAYNGKLASGTIVTIWSIADVDSPEPLLEEVLVLDVQKVEGESEGEGNTFPYVIVLAVPSQEQAELLTAVATKSLFLTLAD